MKDKLGRTIDNLRVSVTDRCNFRCLYCMPEEGLDWLPRAEILSYEEIEKVVRVGATLGIRKVRLTGGEPLVRRDISRLIEKLTALPGIEDLSLTTNGLLLAEAAEELSRAGLRRVNVSLDSLTRETFHRMSRRDALDRVMAGLDAAGRHFEGPIKVNAVILRGINDGEIERFARLARERSFEVRFIEFMPLDADRIWSRESLVTGDEILRRIHAVHPLRAESVERGRSPSRDHVFEDGAGGKIGFINSVSEPFCESCNRVRLTADGKLRTCLFSLVETDLRLLLRGGADDATIARAIGDAVWRKEPGHRINEADFVRSARTMSQIGG